ncbi:MAG: YjgN family protein [Pseudomonadota bacterium]
MDEDAGARAFEFHGSWREFAPIAFTNLLLTIVTLGVYSFWAKTRERQYLWANTRFIDDRLEWTGTGLELFIGYIIAFLVIVLPLGVMNFLMQAMAMQGHEGAAALLLMVIYIAVFYLVGVAVFRALRYRLSRTYWHGIRGGSNEQGFEYGGSHLLKNFLASLTFGLMVPWAMTGLWNRRWNAMSFGPLEFTSNADWHPIIGRYLLYYLAPILVVLGGVAAAMFFGPQQAGAMTREEAMQAAIIAAAIGYFVFFILLGLIAIFYYAAYFREVVDNLSLGDLDFKFEARSWDWFKLMLGSFFLVVFTLGIGIIFVGYRNWAFFIRHMNGYGTVDLDNFSQSTTRAPGQGEGLLDAFDVGAI